jgi:hypothetical protein
LGRERTVNVRDDKRRGRVAAPAVMAEWRWRICDYGGEIIEESHDHFPTIAAAVAQGAERLAHMNAVDRARAARGDSTTMRAAGVNRPGFPGELVT